MRVNKNMSVSTINLIIRPGIIIYNVSSCACFLLGKDAHFVSNEERQLAFHMQDTPKDDFVMPSIQGYNSWPYNSGKE